MHEHLKSMDCPSCKHNEIWTELRDSWWRRFFWMKRKVVCVVGHDKAMWEITEPCLCRDRFHDMIVEEPRWKENR